MYVSCYCPSPPQAEKMRVFWCFFNKNPGISRYQSISRRVCLVDCRWISVCRTDLLMGAFIQRCTVFSMFRVHKRNIFIPEVRNLGDNLYIDLKKRNKTFRTPSFQKNYSREPTRTASASKTWIKMLIWILLSGFVNWYPNYTAQTNMKPTQNSRKTFPNRYAH